MRDRVNPIVRLRDALSRKTVFIGTVLQVDYEHGVSLVRQLGGGLIWVRGTSAGLGNRCRVVDGEIADVVPVVTYVEFDV